MASEERYTLPAEADSGDISEPSVTSVVPVNLTLVVHALLVNVPLAATLAPLASNTVTLPARVKVIVYDCFVVPSLAVTVTVLPTVAPASAARDISKPVPASLVAPSDK